MRKNFNISEAQNEQFMRNMVQFMEKNKIYGLTQQDYFELMCINTIDPAEYMTKKRS